MSFPLNLFVLLNNSLQKIDFKVWENLFVSLIFHKNTEVLKDIWENTTFFRNPKLISKIR